MKIIRDPLVHFLLVGGGLFLVLHFGSPTPDDATDSNSEDGKTIVVDEASLLEFMQFRARAFDEGAFRDRFAEMPEAQRQALIDDYVREEVFYREARAMGLDEDDYIIRRRLVQKLEFVTETLAGQAATLTDEELEAYFSEHREDYAVQAHMTFTHVFFDSEIHGAEAALALARESLDQLNREKIRFDEAVKYGDRFPFHLNYVERTADFITSHFGEPMARQLFEMEVSDSLWQGPLTSPYGAHIVMITRKAEARDAELEEIRNQVRLDAELQQKRETMKKAVDEIVEQYEIRYEMNPKP